MEEIRRNAEVVRGRCQSLHGFVREAWPVLEPSTAFVDGWHIAVLCRHLEAISNGEFLALGYDNRLLINVPPGTMKSLIVGVFWPAWEWGPRGLPSLRYLTTSYSETYAKRDARRMRDLVASEWYQSLWAVTLLRQGETSFENAKRGGREAKAFTSLTAGRGDRVIIDDPHSTETAESPTERATAVRIFRESVTSRLNDPVRSAIVVIMQRLHDQDISGQILALKLGYIHVMLPMEFEKARRCYTPLPSRKQDGPEPVKARYDGEKQIWYVEGVEIPAERKAAVEGAPVETVYPQDPREHDGDLLAPNRFTKAVVDRDKVTMGSYAVAGQNQQRPAPREGGLFQRSWFKIIDVMPSDVMARIRRWDLAATVVTPGTSPDWTVGLRMASTSDQRFIIEDVKRFRESAKVVRETIKSTAETDGAECRIGIPQDPGQAGKDQAQIIINSLVGFAVKARPETGSKETRAESLSAQAEAGNVYLLRAPWNETFIDELCSFPGGAFDDQVDAASGAFNALAIKPKREVKVW